MELGLIFVCTNTMLKSHILISVKENIVKLSIKKLYSVA